MRGGGYRQFNPLQGLDAPGGGGGFMDIMMQMFAQQMLGQRGLFPGGFSGQNMYDRLQGYRTQQMHDDLLKEASKRDTETYYKNLIGLSHLSGTPIGSAQIENARSLARSMARFGPTAVQIFPPQMIDALGGMRGMNVVMQEYMFRGGRHRIDPQSGLMGLDIKSQKRLGDDVWQSMFAGSAWKRHGLSAGEAGQIFNELTQAGMMPGGKVGADDLMGEQDQRFRSRYRSALRTAIQNINPEALAGGLDSAVRGLSDADRNKVRQDPGVSAAIKAFDSRRVVQGLTEHAGVIKAMREIFGDAGHPNAPIPELINALNQLTGGALPQLTPGEVQNMVRTTYNLARNSGIGLQGVMMMSEASVQLAQAQGLEPIFASDMLQGALAYRGAAQGLGLAGGHPAWGQSNINQQMMMDMSLRGAAVGSRAANQAGAALRLAELGTRTVDGKQVRAFNEGTTAAAYIDALKRGAASFVDPVTKQRMSINMDEADFTQMLTKGAGFALDAGTVARHLEQTAANRELIQKHGVMHTVRMAQRPEFYEFIQRAVEFNAQERIAGLGLSAEQQKLIGSEMSSAFTESLSNLTDKERSNKATRTRIMASNIERRLVRAAAGQIEGIDAGEAKTVLTKFRADQGFRKTFVGELFGAADRFSRSSDLFGRKSIQDSMDMMDREGLEQAEQARNRARAQSVMQSAMSTLGRSGALRRSMQAVYDAKPGDDLTDVFGKGLGGVDRPDIAKALGAARGPEGKQPSLLGEARSTFLAMQKASKDYQSAKGFEAKQKAFQVLLEATKKHEDASSAVGELTRRKGFYADTSVDEGDLADLKTVQDRVTQAMGAKTVSDKSFSGFARTEMGMVDNFLALAHSDKATMLRLGPEGLTQLKKIEEAGTNIRTLAAKYTGGDAGLLWRGKFSKDMQDKFGIGALNEARDSARESRLEIQTGRDWYAKRLTGSKDDYSFLTEDERKEIKDIAKDMGKRGGPAAMTMADLLGDKISDKDLKAYLDEGKDKKKNVLKQDEYDAVMGARKKAETQRKAGEERRADFHKSADQILRENAARAMGVKDPATLSPEQVADFYGTEYKAVRDEMTAASRRVRATMGGLLRGMTTGSALKSDIIYDAEGKDAGIKGKGFKKMFDRAQKQQEEADEENEVNITIDIAKIEVTKEGLIIKGRGNPHEDGRK